VAGREHVVEIAFAAPRAVKAERKRLVPKSDSSEAVEKSDSFVKEVAKERVKPVDVSESTESVQKSLESDESERESVVRNHLERFKYYPTSARKRGIVGEVEVAFELDAKGHAGMLKILSESGYRLLDDAALETVRRAQPFPVDGGAFQFRLLFRAS